jgi:hypothetical protein
MVGRAKSTNKGTETGRDDMKKIGLAGTVVLAGTLANPGVAAAGEWICGGSTYCSSEHDMCACMDSYGCGDLATADTQCQCAVYGNCYEDQCISDYDCPGYWNGGEQSCNDYGWGYWGCGWSS